MGVVGLGFRAPARVCEPVKLQVILNVGDSVITSFGVTWFLHYAHSLGFRLEEIQGFISATEILSDFDSGRAGCCRRALRPHMRKRV